MKKYVVFTTGGKQYLVESGQSLKIDKIDTEPGKNVSFDKVLLYFSDDDIKIGKPFLDDIKVIAKVDSVEKDKKIRVAKFKSKSRYKKVTGHRQQFAKITIEEIKN